MIDLQIITKENPIQIEHIRSLLSEYAQMRNHDAALGDFEKELKNLPGKFSQPHGALLLAFYKNKPAGCVAFRKFDDGISEMKRMFVKPEFSGFGIGNELVAEIIRLAKEARYQKMYLDTHPWMKAAQHLYQKFGFTEIPAYHFNPTKGIRFFELNLT